MRRVPGHVPVALEALTVVSQVDAVGPGIMQDAIVGMAVLQVHYLKLVTLFSFRDAIVFNCTRGPPLTHYDKSLVCVWLCSEDMERNIVGPRV